MRLLNQFCPYLFSEAFRIRNLLPGLVSLGKWCACEGDEQRKKTDKSGHSENRQASESRPVEIRWDQSADTSREAVGNDQHDQKFR